MAKRHKPTALKKIEGTYRKDRVAKNELTPTIAIGVEPPESLNEWGVQLWNQVTADYCKIGLITSVDLASLTAVCIEWGRYCEANDIIQAQGLQIEEPVYSQKGELVGTRTVTNTMVKVASDSFKNYTRMCIEFGLTPASRVKISVPEKVSNDRFGEFD